MFKRSLDESSIICNCSDNSIDKTEDSNVSKPYSSKKL